MKKIKHKELTTSLRIFIVAIVIALGFFIYYQIVIHKTVEETKKVEKVKYSDEYIAELYNGAHLSYAEESVMLKSDLDGLEEGIENDKFSNQLKLSYGLKEQPEENMGVEKAYPNNQGPKDKDGYAYTGKYIKTSFVKKQLENILGPVSYTDQSIVLSDTKYLYDSKLDAYRIYTKNKPSDPEKVTYYESKYDEKNIFITEYVAYTRTINNFKTSYTRHNELLPIGITDKNITENLDLIDKYLYTFTYNENVKKFFLTKIEYVK